MLNRIFALVAASLRSRSASTGSAALRIPKLAVASLAGVGLLLGSTPDASATAIITIYDGIGSGDLRSDWEADVLALSLTIGTEDYNSDAGQLVRDDFEITFTGGGHNDGLVDAGVLGALNDHLTAADGINTTLEFDFPIFGFGANWNLAVDGEGAGIKVQAGSYLLASQIPNSHNGEFWGFLIDVPFTTLILTAGTQTGTTETYFQDDVVYAVPEPSAAMAFVFGLATVGCAVRRRPLS